MFVCYKYEMFRISQDNVSDIKFRISFRLSEKRIGFVMTIRLTFVHFYRRHYTYTQANFPSTSRPPTLQRHL